MASPTIDRIIDIQELLLLIPYSNMQIRRKEQEGTFPQRVRLGANRVGWSLNEILGWIAERKSERIPFSTKSKIISAPDLRPDASIVVKDVVSVQPIQTQPAEPLSIGLTCDRPKSRIQPSQKE
jgi:prophage regulatory protein